mmetsp:Transcript_80512/g.251049  ORF Transcript_80512/g.251049 Transcript_80512/m.251049 type:complete len:269 (-) Transcript_80512:105-911(-)
MAACRFTLMIIAVLAQAQAEELSATASAKEVNQDSKQQVSMHVDTMSSSMYLNVERKKVAPHGAQGLSDQASPLKRVLVLGTLDAAVAHFVISPLVKGLLRRRPTPGAREGCAEGAASESSRTGGVPSEESHQREEAAPGNFKRALAGGLVALSALAALGAGKARRCPAKGRRSSRARQRSSTSRSASVDSDLSTAFAATPPRSSDGSRSADSDDEACRGAELGSNWFARQKTAACQRMMGAHDRSPDGASVGGASPETQFFRIGTEG